MLTPLGCFTSCITFKAFIISEDWWWPSDRRADSSISCRSRTGQSRLFTSLGNELSYRTQPRFQQDELQSLVTRWNVLLKAAFILKDPRSLLETESVSAVSNLPCQPFGSTLCRGQKYKLGGREQFSGFCGVKRAQFILNHLRSFRKEKILWWVLKIKEVMF